MTGEAQVTLAPVAAKARIDVLDMLRGIAILGIFFMNIPFMGVRIADMFISPRNIGWAPADAASWTAVQVMLEGTQRGLLELLFGAALMVLAARAMKPDDPVAVADLYLRRNLWLLLFGLFDIFVLLWAGDILHVYALAALALFPFRKLGPKLLLAMGMGFAVYIAITGGIDYAERADLISRAHAVEAKQEAKKPLTAEEKKTAEEWKKLLERRKGNDPMLQGLRESEKQGRTGFWAYVSANIDTYVSFVGNFLRETVIEAFCAMLIGIALWKWRIIQGGRSARFYLALLLCCYIPAITARWIGAQELVSPVPIARTWLFTQEFARLLMSVGHVALINLAVKAAAGRWLLSPFKAAGRTAFSLYFLQQIIGLWFLFAPWWVFNLWGKLSWANLYLVAIAVIAAELVLANIWVRFFAMGPMEWAWRSLAYGKRQPFLKRREEPPAEPVVA